MTDTGEARSAPTKPWSGGGREELADAVRRLTTLTVTAMAPPELMATTARQLGELADRLESHVPEPGGPPVSRFADRTSPPAEAGSLTAAMPFDGVVGSCNPLALPLTIEFASPKALGHAVYTAAYEGAPGCVHGATLAVAFDLVLTAANVMAGAAGPTAELTLRFRKPTLAGEDCLFEAEVTGRSDRRIHSRGRLVQNGVVTVEAEGEFVDVGRDGINAMHRTRKGAKRAHDTRSDGTDRKAETDE
jgi:hypothetical protein